MVFKKTSDPRKLEEIIKNIAGQYNGLVISFQTIFDRCRTMEGELILLNEEKKDLSEKNKGLKQHIKKLYSEISEINDRDKILSSLEKDLSNVINIDRESNETLIELIDIE
jgi:predicted  nucleic acid-binding Zn-ribbon protein